jgi:hypothetical protein
MPISIRPTCSRNPRTNSRLEQLVLDRKRFVENNPEPLPCRWRVRDTDLQGLGCSGTGIASDESERARITVQREIGGVERRDSCCERGGKVGCDRRLGREERVDGEGDGAGGEV